MFGDLAKKLGGFVTERAGSLVSKKLGAAAVAETVVAAANPDLQGVPLIVYIIAQGLVDVAKHYLTVTNE